MINDITLNEEQIKYLNNLLYDNLVQGFSYYEITPSYLTIGLQTGILLNTAILSEILRYTGCKYVYIQNNEIIFVFNIKGAQLRQKNNAKELTETS